MELSIVTVHTNDALILETIASVYKTVKVPFEYIVVDNHANPEYLKKIREKFQQVIVIQNPKNYGYARAINQGIKKAQGEFVLVLNPDVLVFEKTIDEMLKYLKQNQDVVLIGPKLLNADNSLQYSCRKFPKFWTMFFRRGL